ncbi:hypothetical protein BASA81_012800 [Batrachochytrium salamandrivorans]|nr:hypothetical protein BASA81_012800 [Batrachochytrium salamandrivorans]
MFGPLTFEHQQAIKELRESLGTNKDFAALAEYPDLVSDYRLARFVVARNFKQEDIIKMVEDNLAWRKTHRANEVRREVLNKPILAASLPHADFLRPTFGGTWNSIAHGGFSRLGDVVHIEAMGLQREGEAMLDFGNKDVLDKLVSHLVGFFEARNILLDELSHKEGKLVRTFQIRDASNVSLVHRGSAGPLAKTIMQLGLLNYPEIASTAIFVNPPAIFMAILALIKPFIPADLDKKLKFVAGNGDHVAKELLRYVRPRNVVMWSRIITGKQDGDQVQTELETREREAKPWESTFDSQVSARGTSVLLFAVDKQLPNLSWTSTGKVVPKVYYVALTQERDVGAKEVDVLSSEVGGDDTAKLPPGVNEALVVLTLDNSSSWVNSKTFQTKVRGYY